MQSQKEMFWSKWLKMTLINPENSPKSFFEGLYTHLPPVVHF
jgi:hypothetical protein